MTNQIFYFDLTVYETVELEQLKEHLFKGESFVVFTEAEKNSLEFKRYDLLLKKKMQYLKQINEVENSHICFEQETNPYYIDSEELLDN